jgi:S-methylmethionine-dependent homocysteine/selenocysteine methylase
MAANGITGPTGSPGGDQRSASFLSRVRAGAALLLDGATGTELERRGVACDLPLWSARALTEAPDVLEAIHRDYVAAGVDALTANTFRTHARSLAAAGVADHAREWTELAVASARRAAAGADREIFVLGSAAPLEDCYRPDLVPPLPELEREHRAHAEHLAGAGVDAVLVETMNTAREARAATLATLGCGLPMIVSFVCDADARLLSGEPLDEALDAVTPLGPVAVGVNCLPVRAIPPCLAALAATDIPFAVYANLGTPGVGDDTRSDDCTPQEFAAAAEEWLRRGARLVGGCCGTSPDHLRAVRHTIDRPS